MKKDKSKHFIDIVLLILLVMSSIGALYNINKFNKLSYEEKTDNSYYSRRYAFVSVNQDEFSTSVYQYAVEAAKKDNAYVERIGYNLLNDYSEEELMRIAIDTAPDAIIVEHTDVNDIHKLIDEAVDNGIVVITYMTDVHDSKRDCFVGPNYYDLGKKYGNEIVNLGKSDGCNVRIVCSEGMNDVVINNICSGVLSVLSRNGIYEVDTVKVQGETTFDVEKNIRNSILYEYDDVDVIICLDEELTNYVTQTLVDFNLVGKKDILGYYNSPAIIDAISNEVVVASIATNPKAIADNCIEAISEYIDEGHVSSFIYSDIEVINIDNVNQYISADNNEEEEP